MMTEYHSLRVNTAVPRTYISTTNKWYNTLESLGCRPNKVTHGQCSYQKFRTSRSIHQRQ